MTDPLRWADDGSDGSAAERDLIIAARAVGMSPAERARVLAAVAAGCATSGAAAGAIAGSAAEAGGLVTLASWKTVALLALVGGGLAAYPLARLASRHPVPVVPPPVTHPLAEPSPARVVVPPPAAPPVLAPSATRVPPSSAPVAAIRPGRLLRTAESARSPEPARAAVASGLAEESRMVIEARRALQAGDFATCLRVLGSAAAAFPDGALAQEREALAIQALARSGQRMAAAKRAQAFLARYPESPHAADVRAAIH